MLFTTRSCCSDGSFTESKGSLLGTADGMPSAVKTTSGYQSAWSGVPGQFSMADIVRMGKPHNKASHAPVASHHNVQDTSATESFPHLRSHADHVSKVNQSEVSSVQHAQSTDEWPSVEKPAPVDAVPFAEYNVDAELHPEASSVSDAVDHHCEAEEVQEREDDNIGNSGGKDLYSPNRIIPEDDSRGSSLFVNELYQKLAPYQSEAPDYEHHEGKLSFCFQFY